MDVQTLMTMEGYAEFLAEVRRELDRLSESHEKMRPSLQAELNKLNDNINGWLISVGNPNLDPAVRAAIEEEWKTALIRKRNIESLLAEDDGRQQYLDELLDPERIVQQLNRLDDILGSGNPTRVHLELSLHIDRINCFSDGKVVVRTCKLGALAGAADLLTTQKENRDADSNVSSADNKVKPRRRGKRRVESFSIDGDDLQALAHWAADPNRFAGLSEKWFSEDVFQFRPREIHCWARDHATDVGMKRAMTGMTHEQLAEHFRVSIPTIRKALRIAESNDESLRDMPRKMPRSRWHEDNAVEIAHKYHVEGMSVVELAAYYGKSDTTIYKALQYAEQLSAHKSVESDRPVVEDEPDCDSLDEQS